MNVLTPHWNEQTAVLNGSKTRQPCWEVFFDWHGCIAKGPASFWCWHWLLLYRATFPNNSWDLKTYLQIVYFRLQRGWKHDVFSLDLSFLSLSRQDEITNSCAPPPKLTAGTWKYMKIRPVEKEKHLQTSNCLGFKMSIFQGITLSLQSWWIFIRWSNLRYGI